jgi:hypothetical protein
MIVNTGWRADIHLAFLELGCAIYPLAASADTAC